MNDEREAHRLAWRGPTAAWAILMVGLIGLVALGVGDASSWRWNAALALSAAMLLTLAFGLVGIAGEPGLLRLTAGAAAMFLALMAFLTFADLLTR